MTALSAFYSIHHHGNDKSIRLVTDPISKRQGCQHQVGHKLSSAKIKNSFVFSAQNRRKDEQRPAKRPGTWQRRPVMRLLTCCVVSLAPAS
eukprot:4500272-Pleurochrysis_carterae.AAC.1